MATRVDERLQRLFEAELTRWRAVDPNLEAPLRALQRLVGSGGKRVRPAFCYWGFVGAGGDPDDPQIIEAGAAFELLHAFALVHDDVMDGSETRRGDVAAHVEFRERHRRGGWLGEARRFGEGVAILVGDLSYVYADLLLDRSNRPEVAAVWHELRLELNVGQYLDLLGTAQGDHEAEVARRIARYKSGKYTIERPLHLGAALAGRLDLQAALSTYGDPLGEAFQLRDDVLGVFGDEALTGKPVGQDLQEGKPTPLLATAVHRARDDQAKIFGLVGRGLSEPEIRGLQQVIVETGALDEAERRIRELTAQAIAAIEQADVLPEARKALVDLAHFVADRSS